MVQYAVGSPADWPAGMVTCTPDVCSISEDGKQIYVTLEGYSGVVTSLSTETDLIRKLIIFFVRSLGEVYFAVNVIGRFVIPNDWTNEPYTTTCTLQVRLTID